MRTLFGFFGSAAVVFVLGFITTADARAGEAADAGANLKLIEAAAPSLVKVEYTLQYDRGEAPRGGAERGVGAEQSILDERPLETPGFVLSPTQVVVPDLTMHPRFVKSMAVRFGEQVLQAKPIGWLRDQNAMLLELSAPLKDAKPLVFDATKKGPYTGITYANASGEWTYIAAGLGGETALTASKRKFSKSMAEAVVVDASGTPVGLSFAEEMPIDDSWKGSPLNMPTVSSADMEKYVTALETWCNQGIVRVSLSFRSPKSTPQAMRQQGPMGDESTEQNVLGILLDNSQVLVLANLKPNITSRLERIVLHTSDTETVKAEFVATLADFGAFVAKIPAAAKTAVKLSGDDILQFRDRFLLCGDLFVHGEQRVNYFNHCRAGSFAQGFKGNVYVGFTGTTEASFVFDSNGTLIALPIGRRAKIAAEREYGQGVLMTPAVYIKEALADLAKHGDPANHPLSEEEENRVAWLGIELQPLNRELARANNVSDLTNDGTSGGLVTFVYPNSPAAKAGIQANDVILRLHSPSQPKPIEVRVEEGMEEAFPWDRYDECPEQYYDRVPRPWLSAENLLTRSLTDLGFDRPYTVDYFHGGKLVTKDFTVVPAPPHFDSAGRFKSEPLGLSVRDLTFEVRHYFQKKDDEPGVVISKVEAGSKASVIGLKPFEIITHVNDTPVNNVKDFGKLIEGQDELRFAVKRMTKGRLVKFKVSAATTAPARKFLNNPLQPDAAPNE